MGEEAGFMMDEGNDGVETEAPHKAYRHRKKHLYQSIRKQMEFYFSDSNLTKDRFLGNLLKQDPCIDLSIFMRFNRIRALTTDISDIAKALRHSELLSVTEDGTKVFRTKPVQQKENIDDCTIYVEQLPPDAHHDWLRDVFSAYGNVAYVSIPKYRTSGKIKGFAFVEFDTPEEANKTLEAFGARGCRLSSEIAPDKLCSITTFEGEESNVDEISQSEPSEKGDTKEQIAEKDSLQHKRKRKGSHKESIQDSDNEHGLENEESTKEHEETHDQKRKGTKNEEKVKFVEKDENEKPDDSNSSTKRKRKKHAEEEVEDEEIDSDAPKKRRKQEASDVDEKNQGELSEKEDKKEQLVEKDSLQHKRKRRSSHRESIKDSDNEHTLENEGNEEDGKGSAKQGEDSKEGSHDRKRKGAKNQEETAKFVEKDESEKPDESSSSAKRKRKKLSEEEVQDEEIDPDASKNRKKLIEDQPTVDVKVEESSKKKRKKKQEDDTVEEGESEDSVAPKGTKTETIENEVVAPENVQLDQSLKKKRRRETVEENRENTTEEDEQVSESRNQYLTEECETENVEGGSKRNRKRKKKKKNKQDKQDGNASSLQILSKREWKRLRNKYLDLQRTKMKCLKQYLSKQYWNRQMQQCNTDTPEPEVKVSQPRISYTPGVIVYAVLDEPVTDIRKFKVDTKALQDVVYVDVLPGANAAYIRCSTADGAKQLAASNPWVSGAVLKGEEETQYWDKIMADRKVKFSNKIRPKQRGRDKILRRAERELGKHIKFDEQT